MINVEIQYLTSTQLFQGFKTTQIDSQSHSICAVIKPENGCMKVTVFQDYPKLNRCQKLGSYPAGCKLHVVLILHSLKIK